MKKALDDQIDADVQAGRLSPAQGDALKARIDAGQVPLVGGFGHRFGFGHGLGFAPPLRAALDPVASALGVTAAELQNELASGKSLAEIAQAHGKTTAEVVNALVAAAKSRLDQAVKDKRLGAEQESAILSRLQTFFQNLVNLKPPTGFGFHFGPGHRSWTPPSPTSPPTHASYTPAPL